jgi:CheY-like chemotaxis protein
MELNRAEARGILLHDPKSHVPGISSELRPRFPRTGEKPKRVLVIDDEAFIADSLSEILNRSGFDAVAFYHGQKAIDAARQQCPDAVVSDVVMPKLDGVELALTIREMCPATRILLFSGQAGSAHILQEARRQGHEFEVLTKPIHPLKLLERLRQG